jgi:hypothetical protein
MYPYVETRTDYCTGLQSHPPTSNPPTFNLQPPTNPTGTPCIAELLQKETVKKGLMNHMTHLGVSLDQTGGKYDIGWQT